MDPDDDKETFQGWDSKQEMDFQLMRLRGSAEYAKERLGVAFKEFREELRNIRKTNRRDGGKK